MTKKKDEATSPLAKKNVNVKLLKHITNFNIFMDNAKAEFNQKWSKEIHQACTMEDFNFTKQIGSGAFGKVYVAKYLPSDEIVAIKALEKRYLVETGHVTHSKQEVKALNCVQFEFVINLVNFFMDNVYIYLVLPFVSGGEMFFHLATKRKFDEHLAKFYASQVVLAFQYLHGIGLVYRDLKPENIMLCADGYIKLTDFGFCKKINGKRTYTMLGTPQYLAPEIVLSQGYGYAADWWAFGILIYEMSAGFPPFMGTDAAVLEKIPKGKYAFPLHFSSGLKDLIQKLMVYKPSERYGVLKDGANDIKLHEWFKDLDWDGVLFKRVKPPYKPTTEGPSYLSNFDLTVTGELRTSAENEFSNEFATFTV
ncbi:unnamed protein product [Hermetia illucens]|uniref:cAMP-dependent protein kinase n=1 Tax=Hermetia illucens TaxID=343691 RepID=A0A7R8V1H5_HERIL|nr:cAMP-dependent protein kinase catalytic subunit 1-like isoform X2 [Hermetia illucens]CAD7091061.1 unnamed protein product [Hermetia illucens]